MRTHLLARMDSSEEALLGGGASSLFDLQGAFLRMCSQEGLLDFAHEEYVVLYLLSGQGSASPPSCYFGVSVTGVKLWLLSLGPIYLLPQYNQSF